MHPGICVLGGVVAGIIGTTYVQSKAARKLAVKSLVTGMKVKDGITTMIDDAKVEFDDLMAEASYEKAAKADKEVVIVEEIEEIEEPETEEESKPATRAARKKTVS